MVSKHIPGFTLHKLVSSPTGPSPLKRKKDDTGDNPGIDPSPKTLKPSLINTCYYNLIYLPVANPAWKAALQPPVQPLPVLNEDSCNDYAKLIRLLESQTVIESGAVHLWPRENVQQEIKHLTESLMLTLHSTTSSGKADEVRRHIAGRIRHDLQQALYPLVTEAEMLKTPSLRSIQTLKDVLRKYAFVDLVTDNVHEDGLEIWMRIGDFLGLPGQSLPAVEILYLNTSLAKAQSGLEPGQYPVLETSSNSVTLSTPWSAIQRVTKGVLHEGKLLFTGLQDVLDHLFRETIESQLHEINYNVEGTVHTAPIVQKTVLLTEIPPMLAFELNHHVDFQANLMITAGMRVESKLKISADCFRLPEGHAQDQHYELTQVFCYAGSGQEGHHWIYFKKGDLWYFNDLLFPQVQRAAARTVFLMANEFARHTVYKRVSPDRFNAIDPNHEGFAATIQVHEEMACLPSDELPVLAESITLFMQHIDSSPLQNEHRNKLNLLKQSLEALPHFRAWDSWTPPEDALLQSLEDAREDIPALLMSLGTDLTAFNRNHLYLTLLDFPEDPQQAIINGIVKLDILLEKIHTWLLKLNRDWQEMKSEKDNDPGQKFIKGLSALTSPILPLNHLINGFLECLTAYAGKAATITQYTRMDTDFIDYYHQTLHLILRNLADKDIMITQFEYPLHQMVIALKASIPREEDIEWTLCIQSYIELVREINDTVTHAVPAIDRQSLTYRIYTGLRNALDTETIQEQLFQAFITFTQCEGHTADKEYDQHYRSEISHVISSIQESLNDRENIRAIKHIEKSVAYILDNIRWQCLRALLCGDTAPGRLAVYAGIVSELYIIFN